LGKPGRAHHTDRHAFAVQQQLIASRGFQRVAKGVAVIQNCPPARLFALVLLDDVGL
jgi:hypothetical protein